MEDSGTGGRAGFYSGSDTNEFELREFTSRPRSSYKKQPKKTGTDSTNALPLISRSFGKRSKVS